MDTSINKRLLIFFICFICLASVLCAKIYAITKNEVFADQSINQSQKTVLLAYQRGPIFDRNGNPITDSTSEHVGVIFGGAQNLSELKNYFTQSRFELAMESMQQKGYVVTPINSLAKNDQALFTSVTNRYIDNQPCAHLVGYLRDGEGVSGLELAMDHYFVVNGAGYTVNFLVDAIGNPARRSAGLKENKPTLTNGVHMSIDLPVQKIVEQQLKEHINSGSACVIDNQTGDILALASYPTFNPNNVSLSLNKPNSPFVNKAFASYSVGSVFKLAIAAAALESGFDPATTYNCQGNITVADTTYNCHKLTGHGELDLQGALQNSCNCYFINLASQFNTQFLLSYISGLGFGREVQFLTNFSTSKGNLPTVQQLNQGDIQNFCFGQGKLQANILQVASLVRTIVNSGTHQPLNLIKSIDGEDAPEIFAESPYQAMNTDIAAFLKQSMQLVISQGTGHRALPNAGVAGGKTATAQTGVFENEVELNHGWFAGFYEIEKQSYTIVVFSENGGEGSVLPAQVFKNICDEIYELTNR